MTRLSELCICKHNGAMHDFGIAHCSYCDCSGFSADTEVSDLVNTSPDATTDTLESAQVAQGTPDNELRQKIDHIIHGNYTMITSLDNGKLVTKTTQIFQLIDQATADRLLALPSMQDEPEYSLENSSWSQNRTRNQLRATLRSEITITTKNEPVTAHSRRSSVLSSDGTSPTSSIAIRNILNYCRINYGDNGISDEYEEELLSRLLAEIKGEAE